MGPYFPFSLKIDPTKTRLWKELKVGSPLIACRFDPTGKYVFAAGQDSSIERFHVLDGSRSKFSGHQGWVRSLAFSSKYQLMASADYHGVIQLWNWQEATPKPTKTIEAHDGWIRALAVSPDGQTLASCGNDLKIKLWSLPDGRLLKTLQGHDYHVYNITFHPKEPRLVSADLKGKVLDWDWQKASIVRELDAKALYKYDGGFMADIGGIRTMAFNSNGSLLACGGITNVSNAFAGVGNPLVILFDWSTGKVKLDLKPAAAYQGTAWGVAFHPDGFLVGAGGGNGGQLWYWKPDQAASFHAVVHKASFRDMALHPQGDQVAVACSDGILRTYSLLCMVSKASA